MNAVPISLNRGRCRSSVFIVKLNENIEHENASNTAKSLFLEKRQIICSGYLPVTEDRTLYPFSSAAVPANNILAHVLFVLKRYESEIRMQLVPREVNFWRGELEDSIEQI